MKPKQLFAIFFTIILLYALPSFAGPHFQIESEQKWQVVWEAGVEQQPDVPMISPVNDNEWYAYMEHMMNDNNLREGEPYPDTEFLPAELFVVPTDINAADIAIEAPGLIMAWAYGKDELPEGNYASAWKYDYGVDPDISNSTITVTVIPPSQSTINAISFAIQDINGNIRSWWWKVPGIIPYDVPTTVIINTAIPGIAAANPPATGYSSNPAFDITKAQLFLADENSNWIGGPLPIPPSGQQIPGLWNYWRDLIVLPNVEVNKGYHVKYSQPPFVLKESKLILGWDDRSVYHQLYSSVGPVKPVIAADDWLCKDARPVTDIHWWGSFIGWTRPYLPPAYMLPSRFHIGIWTDVPANANTWSHPGRLIWENFCDSYAWNFAGYDKDPRGLIKNEACFQFNQLLSQNEWFYQKASPDGMPTVYWLSIAAIYDNVDSVRYPWGWKTRPRVFNDNAVRIYVVSDSTGINNWPPKVGYIWNEGNLVQGNDLTRHWDLSFELTTNMAPAIVEQGPPGDFNGDRVIDLKEAIHALQVVSGLLIP